MCRVCSDTWSVAFSSSLGQAQREEVRARTCHKQCCTYSDIASQGSIWGAAVKAESTWVWGKGTQRSAAIPPCLICTKVHRHQPYVLIRVELLDSVFGKNNFKSVGLGLLVRHCITRDSGLTHFHQVRKMSWSHHHKGRLLRTAIHPKMASIWSV